MQNCEEGKIVDTYLISNKTATIKVEILGSYQEFCEIEYSHENWNYISSYDKLSGKLCKYEATKAGGFRKYKEQDLVTC